eukprot:NODE_2183_length_1489_cov_97.635432_g2075_i0.p1 GENE.NODE_2183_length_1489_cov_97.635432_g2075_i0~~NODE_2183_length_1489_cov_97.635432_g2075_i0.p1  ORF type:complete len:394 (-),score=71.38 NODE_2183_length_1489_cov_97.635432_g2075_i0:308-1420(-)
MNTPVVPCMQRLMVTDCVKWDPIEVVTRIFVTHIGKIDSSTSEVELNFTLQICYPDPLLKQYTDSELQDRDDWDDPKWFNPAPVIQNKKDCAMEQVQCTVMFGEERTMLREYKVVSIVNCQLDLRKFPFDHQVLSVVIESDNFPASKLKFTCNPSRFILARETLTHQEFRILRGDIHEAYVGYDWEANGPDPDQYIWSRIQLDVHVARRSAFYSTKVGVVFLCCCLMAFCSHALGPESLNDRLSLITTMFLTAVAFQFVVADTLPKIPYFTVFDKLVQYIALVLLLACVESIFVYSLVKLHPKVDAQKIDYICLICNCVLSFMVMVWFYTVMWIQNRHADNEERIEHAPEVDWSRYPNVPEAVRTKIIPV